MVSVLIFPYIWDEYGDLQSKSLYSFRADENANQKYYEYGHFLRSGSFWIYSYSEDSNIWTI